MTAHTMAAAAAMAALILAGCGGPDHGTVIDKDHTAASTYLYCVWVKSVCVPMTGVIPEKWRLKLRDGDTTGWVDVDGPTFTKTEVGDQYEATS